MSGRIRSGLVFATSALMMVGALAAQAAAAPPADPGPPGRYIVVLDDSVGDPNAVAAEHSRAYNAQVSFVYDAALTGYAAVIPNDRVAEVRSDHRVAYISEDLDVTAVAPPGGGGGGGGAGAAAQVLPTGVNRVDAENKATPSGVAVAVIDTGSGPHKELNVAGGKNCSTGRSYNDGNGHGTHVAGTIGAVSNDTGVVGVAPGVPIYSVRVLNNSGSGSWSSVICGIDWVTANAATYNIRVASMSLGGSTTENESLGCSSSALHQAICNSTAKGITYVAAAGNNGADFASYAPATYSEVLTVTAMSDGNGLPGGGSPPGCRAGESDDAPATFSNFATGADDQAHTIAAPGVCIYSTWLNGGYNTISGTSMATPHVSGIAALCIASGKCAPATVKVTLLGDAVTELSANGFTGSPWSGNNYYGPLVYAGAY